MLPHHAGREGKDRGAPSGLLNRFRSEGCAVELRVGDDGLTPERSVIKKKCVLFFFLIIISRSTSGLALKVNRGVFFFFRRIRLGFSPLIG